MQIVFYRTSLDKSLEWDLVEDGRSKLTGERALTRTIPKDRILCIEDTFFLNPKIEARCVYPKNATTQDQAFGWMTKCKFFSLFWVVRLLFGNSECLYQACLALPNSFPRNLRSMIMGTPVRKTLQEQFEQLRADGAHENWRKEVGVAQEDIREYRNRSIPRPHDNPTG